MTWLVLAVIRLYRYTISPALPPACRFVPSCSQYAEQAFIEHGFFRGLRYAIGRLLRCHPWHPGGHDPIPVKPSPELERPSRSMFIGLIP